MATSDACQDKQTNERGLTMTSTIVSSTVMKSVAVSKLLKLRSSGWPIAHASSTLPGITSAAIWVAEPASVVGSGPRQILFYVGFGRHWFERLFERGHMQHMLRVTQKWCTILSSLDQTTLTDSCTDDMSVLEHDPMLLAGCIRGHDL